MIETQTVEESKTFTLEKKYYKKIESICSEQESRNVPYDERLFQILGNGKVRAKNYVGVIQLGKEYQIEILPKREKNSIRSQSEARRVFFKMVQYLDEFKGMNIQSGALDVGNGNIYEVIIFLYMKEVEKLIKRGLKSTYVEVERNDNVYRGKLLVSKQLSENRIHKERFYMKRDEYSLNRAENKLIKAVILAFRRQSTVAVNQNMIKRAMMAFEAVDVSVDYASDITKIVTDRSTKIYGSLLLWTKSILQRKSIMPYHNMDMPITGTLLFPMWKLYENYITKRLQLGIRSDWEICAQNQDKFFAQRNQGGQVFAMRPDIVVKKNNNVKAIMDTKWKYLDMSKGNRGYGITSSDMYQMFAYARVYNVKDVYLIYPHDGNSICSKDELTIDDIDQSCTVHVIQIPVFATENKIENESGVKLDTDSVDTILSNAFSKG